MGSILRFNNLKLAASEQTPRICTAVLEVIGIMAYKNDSLSESGAIFAMPCPPG